MDNFDPNMMKAISDSLPTSTKQKLFDPSADAIGKGLGGILMWVFQKPIEFGIIKQKQFEDLSNKIAKEYSKIPEEKRTDSKKGLMIKTLESARYSMDDETLRSYFAKLLVSTANKDSVDKVTPLFSTILSNIGHEEAKFIELLKVNKYGRLPMLEPSALVSIQYALKNNLNPNSYLTVGGKEDKFTIVNQNLLNVSKQLSVFRSFGLINIEDGQDFNYFKKDYELLQKLYEPIGNKFISDYNKRKEDNVLNHIHYLNSTISLTSLGKSFVDCVIP
ncbi:DUF4393 domain-containing protein [Pediococcus pentosaceus]|uniref:DUF4393 domain-containing protein n=1 Tax=Pediococcus pentosaceus TaxID=1255 RepID=A0AB73HEL1_PEDPE|nr:DUF4393 domain-containing protein [Pediococcus pentosaceus]MBF7114480.1 DUF4393 domain-containing protein [Pediococcus pentosaceus]